MKEKDREEEKGKDWDSETNNRETKRQQTVKERKIRTEEQSKEKEQAGRANGKRE